MEKLQNFLNHYKLVIINEKPIDLYENIKEVYFTFEYNDNDDEPLNFLKNLLHKISKINRNEIDLMDINTLIENINKVQFQNQNNSIIIIINTDSISDNIKNILKLNLNFIIFTKNIEELNFKKLNISHIFLKIKYSSTTAQKLIN
ncbi:expressed protein [Dictyostelium purpureum]|uniref:Expressed protein n=1 Tax=Dictyostelium purpureum TaxID=5786 RepID=F0ZQA1_DICPU|nr:uncharacterized protein DICPUDRAFT_92327 [Dictyostelium purpureum]EGC33869.1 expressed protein [Dictyostelium purpureum]|eukprot:XP_003289607.1 expressed protein [Dictyostelium purpureum]